MTVNTLLRPAVGGLRNENTITKIKWAEKGINTKPRRINSGVSGVDNVPETTLNVLQQTLNYFPCY